MSRLIIKNLPPYLTPEALRKHFTGQASKNTTSTSSSSLKNLTITDVKIAHKPDGTSRRFGFVGFKTEKEAEEAKRWFDKSFIDSMRITVEVVDVSSSRFCGQTPSSRASFIRGLIVVRESGIRMSDQRNAEGSKPPPLPSAKREKSQIPTTGPTKNLLRSTRILKSTRR